MDIRSGSGWSSGGNIFQKVVEQLVRTFSLGGKERTVWDMVAKA